MYAMSGLLSTGCAVCYQAERGIFGRHSHPLHQKQLVWYSYVTIARPQINKVMEASEDMTLKYHANMKVVTALQRVNGKYSTHLFTYSLKGMVRMDLYVYLNEEEYKKLEDSIGKINQWIEGIGVPTHKRNVLKMYRWKITFAKKNEQNEYDIVKCEHPFYTKEDALMEGTQCKSLHFMTNPQSSKLWKNGCPHPMRCNFYSKHTHISFTGPVHM